MLKKPEKPESLFDEIHRFRKRRILWAILLICVGLTGVVIPVVPGTLLFLFALALIRPGIMEKLRRYFGIKKTPL